MIYTLIIYIVIVIPKAIRFYLKERKYTLFSRLWNIVISYLIFSAFFEEVHWKVIDMYSNGINNLFIYNNIIIENLLYKVLIILYYLLCIVINICALYVGTRSEKSRNRILNLVPFMWIISFVNLCSKQYTDNNMELSVATAIFIALYVTFSLGIVFFTYTSKPFKRLFGDVESNNAKISVIK